MDNLLYFLRFKALDRSELTRRIILFIISALALLYLINFISQLLLLNYSLHPLEFLNELMGQTVFGSKLSLFWIPEIVLIAIFGAILLWLLVVFIPWVLEVHGLLTTPCIFQFEPEECLNNIDFQGKVEKRDKELFITSSGSGMLFKHHWRDFEAKFEFKFLGENNGPLKTSRETHLGNEYCTKNNYLGFIFRAKDFDNYFMLSVGVKKFAELTGKLVCKDKLLGKEFLLVTPHVKVNGAWDVFEGNQFDFPEQFQIDDYNIMRIVVRGNHLDLWLEKQDAKQNQKKQTTEVPLFTWYLPTHYLINWGNKKEEEREVYSPGDSSKIPFRNSIGHIGFRAYGDERFLIRNLIITLY